MRFAYLPLRVRQANPALGGALVRYRPIVPIHILSPGLLPPIDACIDSAADDTVFPPVMASKLGITPTTAPTGRVRSAGGIVIPVVYAAVTLLLSDGYEACEWNTTVGFSTMPMRWALLGHTGFLDYFDVELFGARREAKLSPNSAFVGQRIVYAAPTP